MKALFGSLAVIFGIGSAQAAVVGYTSEAAYDAAVGAELYLIDFNGLPIGPGSGAFAGQVDFGSPEASDPSQVIFNSDAMTDAGSTTADNRVGPIDGVFAAPVFAFSMVFSSSGNAQTIFAYDASSSLLGSVVTNPGGFFGLVSDSAVSRFVIVNGEFSPNNRDRFFIDDFAVNAPIPEPQTYAMLLAGLLVLGWGAARRAQVRAG